MKPLHLVFGVVVAVGCARRAPPEATPDDSGNLAPSAADRDACAAGESVKCGRYAYDLRNTCTNGDEAFMFTCMGQAECIEGRATLLETKEKRCGAGPYAPADAADATRDPPSCDDVVKSLSGDASVAVCLSANDVDAQGPP